MKVLMLTDYDAGGTWNIAWPAAEELEKLGHTVKLQAVGKGERTQGLSHTLEEYDLAHFWNIRARQHFDPAPPSIITIHHLLSPPNDLGQVAALRDYAPERVHVVDRLTQHSLGRHGITSTRYVPQAFRHEHWQPLPAPAEFAVGYLGDHSGKRAEVVREAASLAGVPCHGLSSEPWASQEEVDALFAKTSVYMVASFCDGGPLPAQEAMLCGRPVITTLTGFISTMIEEYGGGIFFDGSPESGAKAILKIKDEYAVYAEDALMVSRFLPRCENIAPFYEALYKEIL